MLSSSLLAREKPYCSTIIGWSMLVSCVVINLILIPLMGITGAALTSSITYVLALGMWLFFVGFNYLEATLPSLVSKMVFAGGKGTALGIYSTCQFLGAFAGGTLGGILLKNGGPLPLLVCCLGLAGVWLLMFLPANAMVTATAPASAVGE